jgi:hypothetical protein
MSKLSPDRIQEYILSSFKDVYLKNTWGEKSFFYNPGKVKPHGTYFFTIKEKDGENDKASNLERVDIYRINFCISQEIFIDLFKNKPVRPSKGNSIEGSYDFTQLNILTPHPIYGWMKWVSILNPDKKTFEDIKPLIDESYQISVKKFNAK